MKRLVPKAVSGFVAWVQLSARKAAELGRAVFPATAADVVAWVLAWFLVGAVVASVLLWLWHRWGAR